MKALLIALALLALYAVPVAADSHNCDDYDSQAAAQEAYNADTSDPNGLDGPIGTAFAGEEGVACEANGAPFSCEYEGDCPRPTSTEPPAQATETPQPTVGPEETVGPEATETEVDDKQDEDQPTMPDTGAGSLAPGASVPWGTMGLAASGLLAAGYAVIRRR